MAQTYEIPVVNERVRPFSDPSGSAMTVFKVFVGLTLGLYLFQLSRSRGVSLMNSLVGRIPGIGQELQTSGSERVV